MQSEELRVKNHADGDFTGREILDVITAHRAGVGIITLAPELPGGIELVREFVTAGHRVSIGHTGATYEQALDAITAGVSQATHLFNRMSAMTARAPGVVGAVLESEAVAAEIICDAFHVHPSLVSTAIRAKSVRLAMAITDGTAGAGLPAGSRARLGSQAIVVTAQSALLEDGTLAGSILTMDGAFRMLVERVGLSVIDAARMCASTPAERLGLTECGRLVDEHAFAARRILDAVHGKRRRGIHAHDEQIVSEQDVLRACRHDVRDLDDETIGEDVARDEEVCDLAGRQVLHLGRELVPG